MTPSSSLQINALGFDEARKRIASLAMPAIERRRKLVKAGRKITTATRKRLRGQTGLDGKPWTPRKKRAARKMLRGIGKTLRIRPSDYMVEVSPTNPVSNRIAAAQQFGIDEVMTAQRMAKIHRKGDDKPATAQQAKALREAGFKIKLPGSASGKGWRKASQSWIKNNLTARRAGVILRSLRGEQTKKTWLIPTTPRSFLGATEQDVLDITTIIFSRNEA